MDKAIIYTHDVGKVYAHEPGRILPQDRKLFPRWSLGVRTANFLFPSGQPGVDREGNVMAVGDVRRQTHHALMNLERIIQAGGGTFADVFKVRVFLGSPDGYPGMLRGVEEFLEERDALERPPVFSALIGPTSSGLTMVEPEAFAATGHASYRSRAIPAEFAPGLGGERFAHVVKVGNLAFTSGILPVDANGQVVGGNAGVQMETALDALATVLEEFSIGTENLVRLTTWVAAPQDLPAIVAARRRFLRQHFPDGDVPAATTIVATPGLEGVRVELEAITTTGTREIVETEQAYRSLPWDEPYVQAVKVPLTSDDGSWLRRFTWPSYPPDVDISEIGGGLEVLHPLGNLVFVSSQAPLDPAGNLVGRDGMSAQAIRVFENIRAILEAADGSFNSIVNAEYFFADRSAFDDFSFARVSYYEEHFPDKDWPSSSAPLAGSPVNGALLEVEAIGAVS